MEMRSRWKLWIIIEGERMKKKQIQSIHPGFYLNELLMELGISQYRLAKELGVTVMRINHVINERRPVTAELALRLGRFFAQSPQYWLNLQSRYDMDVVQDKWAQKIESQVHPYKMAA